MSKITKTLLRRTIKDVMPDPKEPGTFRVIADVGNIEYYEQRAIEALRDGDRILAIQLLILAQATEFGGDSGSVASGSGGRQGDEADDWGEEEVKGVRGSDDRSDELKRGIDI